ncbi:MAG: ABC transporter ATP-binding protein [Clostridia bacterium]|nr:ABC transporter ATP-binding protein [Clostridia bacterium]
MKKNKEKVGIKQSFKNNKFIFKTAFKSAPGLCIMRLVMGFITGLNHGITVFLTSEILNALDRRESFEDILWKIGVMAIYFAAYQLFYSWHWKQYNPKHKLRFIRDLHKRFFVKASEIDLSSYDSPEFYNDYVYSMQTCDKGIMNTIDTLAEIIRCIVASVSVFGVVINIDWIVAVVILGFSIVSMLIHIIENGIWYKYEKAFSKIWGKDWYISRFFSLADYAKEVRLTRIDENMKNELQKNKAEERTLIIKRQREFLITNTIGSLLNVAENLFIILFMSYHLIVTREILIGGFAIAIVSANKMRYMFSEIQRRLAEINKQSVFADKVRKFLETESKIISGERELNTFESIEFKNVTFAYQVKEAGDTDGEKTKTVYALQDVSFKINKGDRIALVGYNGAGKTTITKLMMRLYDVTDGEILINGINIKEYRLDMLREKIGAVFQDYKVFAATVAENVLADVYTCEKEQVVLDALRDSTFNEKLDSLPKGIATELTKEFYKDGTELSGGESQKIAIARVFAHNNELIIMDEPSSALDPIAEYNLNVGIDKNARGKTVVFITHRLSTTRHVDMIYMLENGRIIESGSHDDLILADGKYASMFNLQASKYKTESKK